MKTKAVTRQGLKAAFRRITRVIGNFQARLILTILYVVLIAPIGLVVRLVSDPLRLRRNAAAETYWTPREAAADSTPLDAARRQW